MELVGGGSVINGAYPVKFLAEFVSLVRAAGLASPDLNSKPGACSRLVKSTLGQEAN